MKSDKPYLKHILDAIESIEKYTADVKRSDFLDKDNDPKTKDAVIRQFEIIGEATGRLSDKIKNSHPNLPWKRISDMRNKLIHEYFGVDMAVVWKTIETDLPILKKVAQQILDSLARS